MSTMNEEEQSQMIITFDSEGSAHFTISATKVTPMQMLTLAGFLKFEAEFALNVQKNAFYQQMLEQQERNKIVVPGAVLK